MERIWIYQASRPLNEREEEMVWNKLAQFTAQWKAHGVPLAATVEIRYHLFIILSVDQSHAMPSGCSIDTSVRLLKELEQELRISLFDRMQIAYRAEDDIRVVSRTQFEQLIADGKITADTIVFNNLASNKDELAKQWEVPFKQSWHAKVFA
ncbi:hypothetical protein GCM10023231_05310 [Olivibacter ginsenosidimutans]|uniref:ABC transporter ATPase n=1 Tax=Olivibacter ginsenosidimutans TaxID=1176537 RepID=A0ABP9AGV0_9SPHI